MDNHHESLDSIAYSAKLRQSDDRKEYAAKKKYGKTYKEFMSKSKDDRKEYKDRMKYGKHYKE